MELIIRINSTQRLQRQNQVIHNICLPRDVIPKGEYENKPQPLSDSSWLNINCILSLRI